MRVSIGLGIEIKKNKTFIMTLNKIHVLQNSFLSFGANLLKYFLEIRRSLIFGDLQKVDIFFKFLSVLKSQDFLNNFILGYHKWNPTDHLRDCDSTNIKQYLFYFYYHCLN